jgi:hypothetical protein
VRVRFNQDNFNSFGSTKTLNMLVDWVPAFNATQAFAKIPNTYRIPFQSPRIYISKNNVIAFKSPALGVEVWPPMEARGL